MVFPQVVLYYRKVIVPTAQESCWIYDIFHCGDQMLCTEVQDRNRKYGISLKCTHGVGKCLSTDYESGFRKFQIFLQ